MTTRRDFLRTAGVTAARPMRALAFSLLAIGLIVLATPAAAQYCKETIDAINSAKAAQHDHEAEQKALLEQIDKIDKGERSLRQQIQSGDCRPEGADAAAADDNRPSCKVLLDVLLSANKMRDSLRQQIDTLKRMAADAASDEQKLVQLARTGGCPPYGEVPPKKATAPAKKPKKAARKPRRRRATVDRPPRESHPPPPRGRIIIPFGPGGGIGFGF